MKVTINTKTLATALSRVQSVVEARNTIPILSNILLSADAQFLKIEGTDLDTTMSVIVSDVDVLQEGNITVSSKLLSDVVRKLKDGDCTVEAADGFITVKSGRSRFKLSTLPVEDWPSVSYAAPDSGFSVQCSLLKEALESVAFASSTEETRYYLNGVLLHEHDGTLRLVATDGHRLAINDFMDGVMPYGVIIPRKAVHEAIKLCAEGDEITIGYSSNSVSFEVPGTRLDSKLIDATYPDYLRIIPNNNEQKAVVGVASLRDAIDRVSSVAEKDSKAVRLDVDGRTLTTSVSGMHNNAHETVDVEGDFKLSTGVNSKYLKEALARMDGDVELLFSDGVSPMILRPVGNEKYLCLIMPMRV